MTTYNQEYFKRKRIKLGTKGNFMDGSVNEKYLKTFADCGFDWVVLTNNNSRGETRDMILDFCDKNGIEAYLSDEWCLNDLSVTDSYNHHPSYTGSYLIDEPGTDDMPALTEIQNKYLIETGRIPFANLLPMYANAAQLKYGADIAAIEYYDPDPDLYYKYCKTWMDLAACDFVSVDVYPLHTASTYGQYVENLNLFSRTAREHNKDFNIYIQGYGWRPGKRNPSLADLRWQIYTGLSFGAHAFVYWAYSPSPTNTYCSYAIVHRDGTPSQIYYYTKESISEVKRLNDVYMQYKNVGAFNVNCTDKTPYLKMTNPISFEVVKNIESNDPLLVGCFNKIEGEGKALTLVNMNELMTFKKASAKLFLNNTKTVTAWYNGYPQLLKCENGAYNITLDSGEGVFITIE